LTRLSPREASGAAHVRVSRHPHICKEDVLRRFPGATCRRTPWQAVDTFGPSL
jgi:hypothetical protein